MASTDYQGSSSPSFIRFGRSILSMKRDPAIHDATHQDEELEAFQRHVTERFIDLSRVDSHEFLSLSWVSDLLDVFLCCQEEFKAILFNNQSYMTEKLVSDYFERSVKGLDVCNAIRDGIEQIRQWQKQVEIVSSALSGNQRYLGEAQFRRAKKALIELTIGMVDDKQSNSAFANRNRSFGKEPNHQKTLKKFKSFSWSVSRSWSASKQLQAIGNNIVPPKSTNDVVPVAVYTMNNVLLFVMWVLVAAIPCQDRGLLQSHFNIAKNFSWGGPIVGLIERILEESKKKGRRNACGLLKEIEGIERSVRFVNELCDSLQFPLTEEDESEVRKRVEEVDVVSEAIKKGVDPLEKQVRDVFHRIVSSRTQGLDRRNY